MPYKNKPKEKKWYEEVSLGVLKSTRIGSGYGFIIPKRFLDKGDLEYGQKYMVVILKRKREISDELTKSEKVEYERWRKLKEKEKRLMEEGLEKLERTGL